MSKPLPEADAVLLELLARQAEEIIGRHSFGGDLLSQTQAIIGAEFKGTTPTIAHVAKRLGLSPRNLQRQLQSLGTSYNKLLDETCRDIALRLLRERRSAIAEVAFLLGYSAVSAFHRAFFRWTGMAPAQYQRSQ